MNSKPPYPSSGSTADVKCGGMSEGADADVAASQTYSTLCAPNCGGVDASASASSNLSHMNEWIVLY